MYVRVSLIGKGNSNVTLTSHLLYIFSTLVDVSCDVSVTPVDIVWSKRCFKAAFHFRVFDTHVYARKTLNPSTLYIF